MDSRYLPLLRLGVGEKSDVYLGVLRGAEGFRRVVILKRALPGMSSSPEAARGALAAEARILAALQHPNIVQAVELVDAPEGLMLAMEYVPGVSLYGVLSHLIAHDIALPWPLAARIGLDVARGLMSAHAARDLDDRPLGVVHRDITPKNVLVTDEGTAKVVDFGIALAPRLARGRSVTATGHFRGTPNYSSPEQVQGLPVDSRTDIYSLGILLHELTSGRKLYSHPDMMELLSAIVREPAPRLLGAPPVLADLVARMLTKEPNARPNSMSAVVETLEDCLETSAGGRTRDVALWLEAELGAAITRRKERVRELIRTDGRSSGTRVVQDGSILVALEGGLDEMRALENDATRVDPDDPSF